MLNYNIMTYNVGIGVLILYNDGNGDNNHSYIDL